MPMLKSRHHAARSLAIGCGAAALLISAPAASFAEANASVFRADGYSDYVVTDLCSFPIAVHAHQVGTISVRETGKGTLYSVSTLEQDTFTANGVSLTSEQYAYHFAGLLDPEGNIALLTTSGVLMKVPLPDGSTFFGAGRVDQLDSPNDFVVVPDVGTSRGVDAFCAALGT